MEQVKRDFQDTRYTYPADMITKTKPFFWITQNASLRRGSPSVLQRAVQRNLFSRPFWGLKSRSIWIWVLFIMMAPILSPQNNCFHQLKLELLLYLPLKQEEKVLFRTFWASSAWQSHYTRRVFPTQLT